MESVVVDEVELEIGGRKRSGNRRMDGEWGSDWDGRKRKDIHFVSSTATPSLRQQ